jgi:hypothetical protein
VGAVQVGPDVVGIEQRDQVLGQVSNGVDNQLGLDEAHRSGLGDREAGTQYGDIDVGEIGRSGLREGRGRIDHPRMNCPNFNHN